MTRGASLQWLSFYPGEAEVCFPPLVALEVHHSRVEGGTTILELLATTNPSSATIDKYTEERKAVVVELGRNLLEALQATNPPEHSVPLMEQIVKAQEDTPSNYFNDDRKFEERLSLLTESKKHLEDKVWNFVISCCFCVCVCVCVVSHKRGKIRFNLRTQNVVFVLVLFRWNKRCQDLDNENKLMKRIIEVKVQPGLLVFLMGKDAFGCMKKLAKKGVEMTSGVLDWFTELDLSGELLFVMIC